MLWRVSAKRSRLKPPGFVDPCIPTDAARVPRGPGWIHEIKHEGYRMQLRKAGGRVRLFTRRGFDWMDRYPQIAAAGPLIAAESATIDSELVVQGKDGVADFERLHSRTADREAVLFAFDILELDGEDLRRHPLGARKAILAKVLGRAGAGIHFAEHDDGNGEALFRAACKMGLEGIVSKRLTSIYRSGRSKAWLKIKNKKAPGYLRVRVGRDG